MDTSCKKCGADMPPVPKTRDGLASAFTVTAFRCEKCGHWNNIKKRKQPPTDKRNGR